MWGKCVVLGICLGAFVVVSPQQGEAKTIHVPADQPTIHAALDAAQKGDTILVAPGTYRERITLKPGVTVRSEGDDRLGDKGLKRAEATILDGGGADASSPAVTMAELSELDGFTVTRVGIYDELAWQRHFDSRGEELGDDEGTAEGEDAVPAIGIREIGCTVRNCIVRHNGDLGIAIVGKHKSTTGPLITGNLVFRNMGGGIGVARGAEPILLKNRCDENLRAGIGCQAASPLIVENECRRNVRAGIGCREAAAPIIRGNKCMENRRAGIGCRAGAKPLIVGNECHDNGLVAIGVSDHSSATILDNELVRKGGPAPIIAVRDDSTATIHGNRISGGGVAGLVVQGRVTASHNVFVADEANQGAGVWVWAGSSATVSGNSFDGYRTGVKADKATVAVFDNVIRGFQQTAIVVKESSSPSHVYGNRAVTAEENAKVVDVQGKAGVVEGNVVEGR